MGVSTTGLFRNGLTPRTRRACAKALRLQRDDGLKGSAIGAKLSVTTDQAMQLASVGAALQGMEAARLKASELLLLRSLARAEMERLHRGEISSPKSREVEWHARRAKGWCARTINNRLGSFSPGGFGLAYQSPNGHCWLTRAGWTLVLALDEDLA